ncbi:MAG: O-antigen ligase family protein [Planctomycetes bacterium]|nr:O-antigen ligase family protein [Planctomycetota bacterium]
MWPLRTIFYFVAFWAACFMSLVNPIWGVVNYLLVYQMNPTTTWWGKPINDMGIRYSLYAIAFTMGGLVLGRRHVPKMRSSLSMWEIGLLLMLLLAALSTILGVGYGTHASHAFEKLWKMFVFVFIVLRLVTTRTNLRIVIWALVAGSLYLGYDAYSIPQADFTQGRLDHVGGPDFRTTSGLAAHMSAMLPIIGLAFLTADNWRWRAFASVAGAFSVNAIILCRTRSAFIGLTMGALTALLLAPRARRWRIHALLVAGAIAAFSLTDSPFWDRMATLGDEQALSTDPATETRVAIWAASLTMLSDYPLGVGIGNFTRVIGHYDPALHGRASHNTVLVAFTELGVQGGILLLLLVFGSVWYSFRCSILAPMCAHSLEIKLTAYGLLIACVTFFVTGLGTERFLCESFWWVLALPHCLHRVVLREIAAADVVPELATHGEVGTPLPQGLGYA